MRARTVRRLLVAVLVAASGTAGAQYATPQLFYTDIVSGPATGGLNNRGAFVTLYGNHFGATRGSSTVTIGGAPADTYPVWSDSRITVQLGPAAHTGPILVLVTGQSPSNAVPFTVRQGNIYFVSSRGQDIANGSAHSPWHSIPKAASAMAPGDITYVEDGVQQMKVDDYSASLAIARAGAAGQPIALVASPGAHPQIGATSGIEYGLRTPAIHGGPFSHWVVAGFTLRGGNEALGLSDVADWRIVGNDISCPHGGGNAGCVEVSASTNIQFLGNTLHDISEPNTSKAYHSLYFTTDSNHIEVAWNTITHNNSCRGIQFHSSPDGANSGYNQYDLSVHDNRISGQVCDGINFATIDPSKGAVVAYNNVIEHVGHGPDPPDGESSYACIASPGITNTGKPGSGTATFSHNTLSDCGAHGGADAGAFNIGEGSPRVRLEDNTVHLEKGEPFFSPSTSAALVSSNGPLPAVTSSALEMRIRSLMQSLADRARVAMRTAASETAER